MKFVISSGELFKHLQAIGKVISSKNTLPILDNYLFQLEENVLTITASDLETTLITTMMLEEPVGSGSIALDAKRLNEILKEFPEQPLTFEINNDNFKVELKSDKGEYAIMGQNAEDFPQLPDVNEEKAFRANLSSDVLNQGVSKTLFATADDELRPVMNGIFIEISSDNVIFVASDSHKLVRYTRTDFTADASASLILPKKPASLLRNIIPKEAGTVEFEFDDKNAFFTMSGYKLICRLTEGKYPSYNSVIPSDNPNKLIIDRLEFYNCLKRVSVFSNQASYLIKVAVSNNQVIVSAQDIDYSISGVETLPCQYDGDDMEIGFKSIFLIEILANLSTPDIILEMSDPSRAGLLFPFEGENENEDVLMLIMPMMINN
ncbi:MAG: DNA polymerase III subunit beta [Bacteroidales bacterium]|nr:DNA polymerase III subunit beta [Bacteroidales bacterium]MCF8455112.1 DNA polymerase III subunit beta [Bacteroidales bacterium]